MITALPLSLSLSLSLSFSFSLSIWSVFHIHKSSTFPFPLHQVKLTNHLYLAVDLVTLYWEWFDCQIGQISNSLYCCSESFFGEKKAHFGFKCTQTHRPSQNNCCKTAALKMCVFVCLCVCLFCLYMVKFPASWPVPSAFCWTDSPRWRPLLW